MRQARIVPDVQHADREPLRGWSLAMVQLQPSTNTRALRGVNTSVSPSLKSC